jgi:hypothetical protein
VELLLAGNGGVAEKARLQRGLGVVEEPSRRSKVAYY